MFDQIVGEKTARKPFAVAVSISGQAVVLGLTILFPLLRTQAITPGRPTQFMRLRPWSRPHSEPQKSAGAPTPARPGLRIFSDHSLRQPSFVPARIELVDGAPSMSAMASGPSNAGLPDGVFGVFSTDVSPPPKPAAPYVPKETAATPPPRVKVGGNVQAAKLIRQATPVYPALAKQARISGVVHLEAVISRAGTIESLQVISGHPLLVSAALEAVRQWVYRPTVLDGDPVEVLTQIEVRFKLGE